MRLPLHIYTKQELMLSKHVPLQNIKTNQLCLITSAQHLINRRKYSYTFFNKSNGTTVNDVNVTDATSPSCHDLNIQDICHKAYLMQSVMPNETFNNCTKIFQVFSKKPWLLLSLYMFVLKSQLILLI